MAKNKKPSELTYKIRRAGVTAAGVGLGALGGYAAAKGLDLPTDAMHGALQQDLVVGGSALGGLGTEMLKGALHRNGSKTQFKDHL